MPPNIKFAPRPAPYLVTPDSPSELTQEVGLTSKTLLVFQDLDGRKRPDATTSYTVSTTVAKLVIHDVTDLTITVREGVVTTLEVHNATNLKLRLEDHSEIEQSSSESGEPGESRNNTSAAYGTVTLDPHLDNVTVDFGKPSVIGAIIVTRPSEAAPSRSLNTVTLSINGEDAFSIDSSSSQGQSMPDGRQSHLFYSNGWKTKQLERQEKDYPSLMQ